MSVKKKIIHIIPNLGAGGAQRVFSQLSVVLHEHYQLMLCVFNKEEKELYQDVLPYSSLDVSEGKNMFFKFFNIYRRIQALKKIKQQFNPKLSISHLEGADLINVLCGRSDVKIIVLHGSKQADVKYKGIYHFFRHKILNPVVIKRADHIVCVSEGIRKEIITLYKAKPDKVSVIYNFFEIDKIKQLAVARLELSAINELFAQHDVLINCARLDIQKNIQGLLDVFVAIHQQSPNVRLLLLGDGDQRETLIAYAKASGLKTYDIWSQATFTKDAQVYFLGNIENPFPYIQNAKLFALTSGWEGFPLALGEAMICGTPIVSTDCPTGPREMLAPGTDSSGLSEAEFAEYGILMPMLEKTKNNYVNTVKLWSEIILKLLKDEALLRSYREKGQQRMSSFSMEKITHQWSETIETLYEKSKK